jgi:iron(III) transport system ATP-binding protein
MSELLWDIKQVSLGSPVRRLADVDLQIESGMTAVLGYSGAGKTSLLNLLVDFECADAGDVIQRFDVKDHAHSIPLFWVPQDDGLWPGMSCKAHVESVLPQSQTSASEKCDDLLGQFDLIGRANAEPDELSQGERGRLSIARALATNAKVYVFDEPLAHVDPARLFTYWSVIVDAIKASGSSLVFATHRPDVVLAFADHVICLDGGELLYSGNVSELYRNPPSERAARCIGEVNWLTADESDAWLGSGIASDDVERCVRPENLVLEARNDGECVVESVVFRGLISDVQLRHERLDCSRHFIIRSGVMGDDTVKVKRCEVGQRVCLRFVAMVFAIWLPLLLFLTSGAGCGQADADTDAAARLPVTNVAYHSMLPDGASLPPPRAVANGRDGELIVLDKAGRVLIFDYKGEVVRQWRMPASDSGHPEGACLLSDGRIAVADTHYNQIIIFDQQGRVDHAFGSLGRGDGQFIYPVKVVQDDDGDLYVIEYGGNDRIQKFTVEGKHIKSFATFGSGENQLARPAGLAWHEGKLYVAEADNHRVQVFTDEGVFVRVLGDAGDTAKLDFPYDLSVGKDGLIYVIEYGGGRVTIMRQSGELVGTFGQRGRGADQFATPWGIAVDPRGHVWIADTGNRRVIELTLELNH